MKVTNEDKKRKTVLREVERKVNMALYCFERKVVSRDETVKVIMETVYEGMLYDHKAD